MRKVGFSFLIFSGLAFLSSCGSEQAGMPRSSGKTAEMIVATNSNVRWSGMVGQTIRDFFTQDFEILPQPEPLFEMSHIPIPLLLENKMFKGHHNILIAEIDEKVEKVAMEAKKDLWASPQRVIRITAPSEKDFVDFFEEKKEVIYNILMDSEYERLRRTFKGFRDQKVVGKVRDQFQFALEIPSGFYIATHRPDFMWIRREAQQNSLGLMIYTYDFIDTLAFDVNRVVSFRNAITEEFIPGPTTGSYMAVADDFYPVISKPVNLQGMYAIETRGLWKLIGDFMGGPFINFTFVDERTNKVVTIDGYVYAPNAPKRDLLIQAESIIRSIRLLEQEVK
jgi:hypothetical protein